MLLGQLLYFEKELGRLSVNPTLQALLEIDIASINPDILSLLKGNTDQAFVLNQLKNSFIISYKILLSNNELNNALNVWNLISDHKKQLEIQKSGSSAFQNQVIEWVVNGSSTKVLHSDILRIGRLATNEEDFALYYGIHFLDVLLQIQNLNLEVEESDVLQTSRVFDVVLSDEIELLVVAPTEFSPLFLNINIGYIDSASLDLNEKIDKFITQNPNIKLILIDEQLDINVSELKQLNNSDILVSSIDFNPKSNIGYFDDLVKKTLGIKLS